jgi:subtilase family serine protease
MAALTTRRALALIVVTCLGLSFWTVQAGAAKKLPNLKTTQISNPPATAHAGDSISISNQVKNTGRKTAPKSTGRFYLSEDTKKSVGDIRLIGNESIGKLSRGATAHASGSFAIPNDAPDDTFYVIGCADDTSAIHESNEKDNCRASTTTMVVQGF